MITEGRRVAKDSGGRFFVDREIKDSDKSFLVFHLHPRSINLPISWFFESCEKIVQAGPSSWLASILSWLLNIGTTSMMTSVLVWIWLIFIFSFLRTVNITQQAAGRKHDYDNEVVNNDEDENDEKIKIIKINKYSGATERTRREPICVSIRKK